MVTRTTSRQATRTARHLDAPARVAAFAALATFGLGGCAGLADDASGTADDAGAGQAPCPVGTSLTLVVPVHQGAPAPTVPQEWRCAIEGAVDAGVPISVVTSEGAPRLALRGYVATLDDTNPETLRRDVNLAQTAVIGAVMEASAGSDGNDLLGALALAADAATAAGPGGVILSLDPGVTDTGVLRTADEGMTLAAPEDVAVFVSEHGACPALTDTEVAFYSLGYTAAPQPALSRRQVANLAGIWVAVAQSCGATATHVPLPRTGDGPDTARTTATAAPEPEPTMAPAASCQVEVPDSEIGFAPDSAELLDPVGAAAVVDAVAARLSGCQGSIEVAGMTSSAGTPEGRAAVAGARADRVRGMLAAALGVDPGAIAVRAVGFDLAQGSVQDRVGDQLSPTLASANRKVVVTVQPGGTQG